MDYPVGFPFSGNPQTPENLPPLNPATSPNQIPLSQNFQSSENPANPTTSCNGPPAIFTPEEMNAELAAMTVHSGFSRFMRMGRCRDYFNGWYVCMDRVIYHGEDSRCCLWLAGILRDCMFENFNYYQPLLSHLRRRTQR